MDKLSSILQIVGPMGDNADGIFGGYAPDPDPEYVFTPKRGLAGLGKVLGYASGCKNSDPRCGDYDASSVKMAARGSQLIIVCLGTGETHVTRDNDILTTCNSS